MDGAGSPTSPVPVSSRQASAVSLPRQAEDRVRTSLASLPSPPEAPSLRQRESQELLRGAPSLAAQLELAAATSPAAGAAAAASSAAAGPVSPRATGTLPQYVGHDDIVRRRSAAGEPPAPEVPGTALLPPSAVVRPPGAPQDIGYISNMVTGVSVSVLKDHYVASTLGRGDLVTGRVWTRPEPET